MIWHSASVEDITRELNVDPSTGLFSDEADRRLTVYGKNQTKQSEPKSLVSRIGEQFKDSAVILLGVIAVISFLLNFVSEQKNPLAPLVILALLILKAAIGVVWQFRAENALDEMHHLAAPMARVRRDRVAKTVPADDLVPGDILLISAGDYLSADARLIETVNLHCDERAVTGETVPVEKKADTAPEDITPLIERTNMVYAGSTVTAGSGTAIVTATGVNTEAGHITTIVRTVQESNGPLRRRLAQVKNLLHPLVLLACGLILVIGLVWAFFSADRMNIAGSVTALLLSVSSLAVAIMPESLVTIATVTLALCVKKMVHKKAILRDAAITETLANTSVICSDKTGTLTGSKMTVMKLYDGEQLFSLGTDTVTAAGVNLLTYAALCTTNTARMERGREVYDGDPTGVALSAAASEVLHRTKEDLDNFCPRLSELFFSSERKLMTAIHMIDGRIFTIVKGAPDSLFPCCTESRFDEAVAVNQSLADESLRVLAVGIKELDSVPVNPTAEELECDLSFCGLIGLYDPPRRDTAESVELCKVAGIRPVMITGDQLPTAVSTARMLGMMQENSLALTGEQLAAMSEEEFDAVVERVTVYACVSPEDKMRIVSAWQKRGETVAVTGDSVADAPALKAADIGCAMGKHGTDVAKGSADIILTDDGFSAVVSAVKVGRTVSENIRKAIHYLLSCNLGLLTASLIGIAVCGTLPFTAAQYLWIALLVGSLLVFTLGAEPSEDDVMAHKPFRNTDGFFSGGLGITVVWQGILLGLLVFLGFFFGQKTGSGSSLAFAVMSFASLLHLFNTRSQHHSVFTVGIARNKRVLLAAAGALLLFLLIALTPLGKGIGLTVLTGKPLLYGLLLSLPIFLAAEAVKWFPTVKAKILGIFKK